MCDSKKQIPLSKDTYSDILWLWFLFPVKEEEVDLSEYYGFADATRQIGNFIEDV